MSEGDKTQEGCMEATPTSPSTNAVTRAAEQREQMEGEQAEETESGTTDEVIDLEVLGEAIPEQAASSPNETKVTELARATSQSLQQTPASLPPAGATAEIEKTGAKRPASIVSLQEEDERRALSDNARAGTSEGLKSEGGHPCGRPPASSACASLPVGEAKRRNRWAPTPLAVSAAPPQGWTRKVTPPIVRQKTNVQPRPAPQTASQPRPQGPLAVKPNRPGTSQGGPQNQGSLKQSTPGCTHLQRRLQVYSALLQQGLPQWVLLTHKCL